MAAIRRAPPDCRLHAVLTIGHCICSAGLTAAQMAHVCWSDGFLNLILCVSRIEYLQIAAIEMKCGAAPSVATLLVITAEDMHRLWPGHMLS